jgi:hypothetical protein
MKTRLLRPSVRAAICGSLGGFMLAFCSAASATLVTWNFNPDNKNESLGTSSFTFTMSGFSITAYGFDNVIGGPDTSHTLYYKDVDFDHGLGLVGTPHNELQNDGGVPLQYIQFDINSVLTPELMTGRFKVSSVDPGEAFTFYGSNTLGELGTNLNPGGYDDTRNNQFVNIPGFGDFRYYSVVSTIADVLPFGFQASFCPIPEIGGSSAAIVLAGFLGLVLASPAIRGRRMS